MVRRIQIVSIPSCLQQDHCWFCASILLQLELRLIAGSRRKAATLSIMSAEGQVDLPKGVVKRIVKENSLLQQMVAKMCRSTKMPCWPLLRVQR